MTADSSMPRSRALAAEARRILTPAFVPAETLVSMPIPLLRDGKLAAGFFAATTIPRPDGTNEDMLPPTLELVLDWETGAQLELRVLESADLASKPTVAVRPLTFQMPLNDDLRGQIAGQVQRLEMLMEPVVARYGANPQRPPMDDGTRYLEQFQDLVPRAAQVYYKAMNPDFYAWVEKGR